MVTLGVSKVFDILAKRDREASALYFYVCGQRRLLNIPTERSIYFYMDDTGAKPEEYERLKSLYMRVSRDMRDAGIDIEPCKECPSYPS